MGFELVQVRLLGNARRTLQVMAEPGDRGRIMTVEDCAEISHALSAVLDVADPIAGTYDLEVSSPGIDRPLVRLGDFARFAGFEARVETAGPIEGRKRFRGAIEGVEEDEVVMTVEGARYRLPFDQIRKARLVLTDALLASAAAQARA